VSTIRADPTPWCVLAGVPVSNDMRTCAIVLFLAAGVFPALSPGDDSKVVLVGPGVMRGLADSVVLPLYPTSSVKANHTGVAVVDVVVSSGGKVAKAEILQSPDEPISNAVVDAVKQWTFHPFLAGGVAVSMHSRLIFYFRVVKDRPSVIDATRESPPPEEQPR
jgi:TonB family protein